MFKTLLTLITATVIAGTAWCADTTMVNFDKEDAEFIRKAALSGMLITHSSDVALKRGLSGDDKVFAQSVLDAHTKSNKELRSLAEKKGVTLSGEFDEKHQGKLDKISKASDANFAERYLEGQISAHKDAIDLFEAQAEKGKDPDLKAFAASTLPHLKSHLEQAKRLENKY